MMFPDCYLNISFLGRVIEAANFAKASAFIIFRACVTEKSSTLKERWEGPGLISGGATHPIRPAFRGGGNDSVTSGIRANPDLTLMPR